MWQLEECSRVRTHGFPYLLRNGGPLPMDGHGQSISFDYDYSWLDSEVTEVVSHYQSVNQLNEISWSLPGSWAFVGPKGAKRACSRFGGCGFVSYNILNGEVDASAPFSCFELGVLHHLKVSPSRFHPLS